MNYLSIWMPEKFHGLCLVNKNGGHFHPGRSYDLLKKEEVGWIFLEQWTENFPLRPTMSQIAQLVKVSWPFARKIIEDYVEHHGCLTDPPILLQTKNKTLTMILHLDE